MGDGLLGRGGKKEKEVCAYNAHAKDEDMSRTGEGGA